MKWMEKVDPDLRRLYRYFLPHKWRLAVAVVFLMGSASMSSVTATLLGKMTDIGFYHQEGLSLIHICLRLNAAAFSAFWVSDAGHEACSEERAQA